MNDDRLKVFIERDRMFGREFAVRMAKKNERGFAFAHPVQWEVRENDSMEIRPCFSLDKDEAQAFMDELWHVGFRPTEGSGSAGSLAATERHLKDLQRLVFKDKPAQSK